MYKVLIVDDSKLARMYIAKALKALQPSWTQLEASSADEALMVTDRERPDIALLDINMPGRDGLALAAEFRAIAPAMPLAVVSANSQDEIVARARELGAAFLPKPVTEQALGAFLAEAEARITGAA